MSISTTTTNGNGTPGTEVQRRASAIVTLADRMGVTPDRIFMESLRSVAFKAGNATDAQLLALCVVSNQYGLNPFTRELYAFPDKGGGIVPIVSVDGWTRIMNEHPAFRGYEILWSDQTVQHAGKLVPAWCEVVIHRSDREVPTRHREWFDETVRGTDPWKSHPRRMLEHKALIQTIRRAFGFSGIYDPDEAERISRSDRPTITPVAPVGGTASARLAAALQASEPLPVASAAGGDAMVVDVEPEPADEPTVDHDDAEPVLTLEAALAAHIDDLMAMGGSDEPGEADRLRLTAIEALCDQAVADRLMDRAQILSRGTDGFVPDPAKMLIRLRAIDAANPGWGAAKLAAYYGTEGGGA